MLNQKMSSAGIGIADFYCNIYRLFCWIYRFFVNSTDESVECTVKSVRFTDFQFLLKFVNLTDNSEERKENNWEEVRSREKGG